MKQVLIRRGLPAAREVPPPALQEGLLQVRTRASCISPGTEMMGLAASGKSLLQRALEQPDKARAALAQMRREGVGRVLRRARQQAEGEKLTGYSAAGVVEALAPDVTAFQVGDPVAVAGAAFAYHAEQIVVPVNLAARIPSGVGFDAAATVALGAIALQSVRRAECHLGETVVVQGCGALGLIAVQLSRAAGCRVVAVEPDPARLELARTLGADLGVNPAADDAAKRVGHFTGGVGADAVIVAANTTSNEPLRQAFRMARRRGRVVLLGVVGPEFSRDEMYAKELDFVISTSYGPGRYDEAYERWGADYPVGYVRWTEQRNMQAYLELLARGQVRLERLLGARFPVEQAEAAYAALRSEARPLLVTFDYPAADSAPAVPPPASAAATPPPVWAAPVAGPVGLAVVGAGGFVRQVHLPNLKALGAQFALRAIVNATGPAARAAAEEFPGCQPGTDLDAALRRPEVQAVLIGTRHHTHADLARRALLAGKAVFLEKPLCLHPEELAALSAAVEQTSAPFFVGYNRRFAPTAAAARDLLKDRVNPVLLHYRMNAGYLPYTHWTQTAEGGGRLLGEACHILDLFRFLVGQPAVSISIDALSPATDSLRPDDNCVLTVKYRDGSLASLVYTAAGNPGLPKERLEAFFDEKALVLDDYLTLSVHGMRGRDLKLARPDKGHYQELRAFHSALVHGPRFPIPWDELCETWWLSWQAAQECRRR